VPYRLFIYVFSSSRVLTSCRIDTQDVLLRDFAAERIVEVGPAETLVNMAKKTVKASYGAHDTATGLKRDYLSYKKNADSIYYKVDAANAAQRPAPKSTVAAAPASVPATQPEPAVPAVVVTAPAATTVAAPAGNVSVPDTPVAAVDILTAIVALALKKQTNEVAKDQTIKKLCGGK
jgi:fatty acid synthase subunit alpha, fungi type